MQHLGVCKGFPSCYSWTRILSCVAAGVRQVLQITLDQPGKLLWVGQW